jgi:hypothetical protein
MKTPHCYKQQIINNKPKNQILPECNIFYVVGLELWEICTPAVMYGAWMYRNFFLIHRIIKVVACHTPFRDSENEAFIHVPRMFHSHV